MEQAIYFTEEWQKDAEETRKSLDEGNGITFPNAKEAVEWLKRGGTIDEPFSRASH